MELNLVMTIVARARHEAMEDVIHSMKLPLALTLYAKGTATMEHLSLHGLAPTEYALILTVADFGAEGLRVRSGFPSGCRWSGMCRARGRVVLDRRTLIRLAPAAW